MKKYKADQLEEAIRSIENYISKGNPVVDDFVNQLKAEHKKQTAPKFVKATDAYLNKLNDNEVYIRPLKETDEHYYQGMQGLFEKKTNKLLRRHTDTGFLFTKKYS